MNDRPPTNDDQTLVHSRLQSVADERSIDALLVLIAGP
jgi:hypothetical protein